MSSAAELDYVLAGCADDVREDGRSCLDVRHFCLELDILPQVGGSCRLRSPGTELVVGVVAVLAEPDASFGSQDAGRILVSVGINGPGDVVAANLPEYENAAKLLEEKRLWLESALSKLYSFASVPDALRTLCIVPGRQCWELRIHVQVLRADGCPLDAASLAIRGALHATRVPHVVEVDTASADQTVDGKKPTTNVAGQAPLDLDLDETLDDSTPFNAASLPLFVTLCDLGGKLVADCNAKERRACGATLSLALDSNGSATAVVGGGSYGLHFAAAGNALAAARAMCSELHEAAGRAVRDAALSVEQRHGGTAYAEFNAGFAGLLT